MVTHFRQNRQVILLYEWIKDYQKLTEEIAYLEFNLEQTERELKRWIEGDLSKVKLQEDSLGAKVEENIERIKSDLEFKRKQRDDLIKLVNTFKGLDNKILRMKYIEGKTLEQIAETLNYSVSHIRKKHAELMRTIRFVDEYCSL
jgi:RNA polymerase sigma factor (sigma-70 family)